MLWSLIQFETLKANAEYTVDNPSYWSIHDKKYKEYMAGIYFTKFLMLFSCILIWLVKRNKVAHIHPKKRLALILVTCVVYILYSFVNQIEAKKQSEMAKIHHIDMKLQIKREKLLKSEDIDDYEEKIRKYKGRHSVEFLAGFYIVK